VDTVASWFVQRVLQNWEKIARKKGIHTKMANRETQGFQPQQGQQGQQGQQRKANTAATIAILLASLIQPL